MSGPTYRETGKYQSTDSLVEMVKGWHPEMMKPKLYNDWELREGLGYRHFTDHYNAEVEKFLETGLLEISDA